MIALVTAELLRPYFATIVAVPTVAYLCPAHEGPILLYQVQDPLLSVVG